MSDSISILLHSAARGARLQWKHNIYGWIEANTFRTKGGSSLEWRIHPDDQHLRYGPISRVLFEAASTGEKIASIKEHDLIEWYVPILKGERPTWEIPEEDRQWFLLMLAEELVWEGL